MDLYLQIQIMNVNHYSKVENYTQYIHEQRYTNNSVTHSGFLFLKGTHQSIYIVRGSEVPTGSWRIFENFQKTFIETQRNSLFLPIFRKFKNFHQNFACMDEKHKYVGNF